MLSTRPQQRPNRLGSLHAVASGVVHDSLHALLAMCLKKDVRERLRDAGDVKLLLAAAVAPGAGTRTRPRASRARWIAATLICVGAAMALGWVASREATRAAAHPRLAFDISLGTAVRAGQ